MVSLGIDLETEILVLLPLKSLIRFRCVQRSWNDLIRTPTFAKRRQMNKSDSHLLILYKKEPYVTLLSCDNLIHIKSLFSNKTLCKYHTIESYGSCNGVFFLKLLCSSRKSCHDELIMWNPTTKEVHRVPPSLCLDNYSYLHGFGADDPNNISFKVVKLGISYDGIRRSAEVYNLSTNSWTPAEQPPPFTEIIRLCPGRYNTLVNGVYHWITNITFYYCKDHVANILCFDFRNNQFHQLRGPTFSVEDRRFQRDDVAEIKGSLAYVTQHYFDSPIVSNIWVMDQSGWHKKYTIGPLVPMSRMVGLWKNGDELLGGMFGKPLTSYDHQGKSLCQFQINVHKTVYWIQDYVPSIAPLSTKIARTPN